MMLKLLAKILSYLFHPLLMPTYLFGIMMFYFPGGIQPSQAWLLIIILIFGMTFILPILNMMFFKMTGTIHDFQLNERKDRILPFIFVAIVYGGITAMIFWKMSFPLVSKLMLIITVLSLAASIATFFFKISVHALACGGLVGCLLSIAIISDVGELVIPSLVTLIVAGFVMSARLLLGAHNVREVSWGGIAGFVIGFAGVNFLL